MLTRLVRLDKRHFWRLSAGEFDVTIIGHTKVGVFFTHEQIEYRLRGGLVDGDGSGILKASLEHLDKSDSSWRQKMIELEGESYSLVGRSGRIFCEKHWLGVPWKGQIDSPEYILGLTLGPKTKK